ncbi:MAG: SMP-30/gluconolactonase/LRE family protein [Rhodospirillaceae bacterium]|nr:SMP-30/gluconolactonase/LRE family protein [Rhodospirillaceae bacterium]
MMKKLLAVVLCLAATPAAAAYRAGVLVPAGPFHGVHGLAFGPDGALYAGDIMGSTVHRIDVRTGRVSAAVRAPEGMADDVAFAPPGTPFAGTMVWTAIAAGKLYAKTPDGAPRVLADNLPNVNTVGFAPDGTLYVTQTGPANKTLWRVDLSGKSPPEKLWDATGSLNGFVIAADGFLYGPQADLGQVIRLDLRSMEIQILATGFNWPTAVEMDKAGLLYVLDFNAGTVTQLNKDTGAKTLFATLSPGVDNMAMNPAGDRLYVSSIGDNGIHEIDLSTKDKRAVVRGQLTAPGGVAVLGTKENAQVYIADMFTLRCVNAATGEVSDVMPINGTGVYPATVQRGRVDDKDVLLTASWFNGRVQVIDPADGKTLREEKDLAAPHDVLTDDAGALLVAEAGAKRVTRVSPDGARETIAEGFLYPVGLARSGDTLYVTDADGGTVTAVSLSAKTRRIIADKLLRPEGIALLADGGLAVVDSAAQILWRLDPATGARSDIATRADVGLTPPAPLPPSWIFNGIAEGPDGTLYLTSDMQAGVFALRPEDGAVSTMDALRRLTSRLFR